VIVGDAPTAPIADDAAVRIAGDPSLDPSDYRFVHRIEPRFAETDAMGVIHHAAYLPWLEETWVALLGAAGHPYHEVRAGGLDIAVIELFTSYLRPVRFGAPVEVSAALRNVRRSTFEIHYLVRQADDPCTSGVTLHACLDHATGRAIRVPEWIASL
jgi:acyl-CoA thioester hydrolase